MLASDRPPLRALARLVLCVLLALGTTLHAQGSYVVPVVNHLRAPGGACGVKASPLVTVGKPKQRSMRSASSLSGATGPAGLEGVWPFPGRRIGLGSQGRPFCWPWLADTACSASSGARARGDVRFSEFSLKNQLPPANDRLPASSPASCRPDFSLLEPANRLRIRPSILEYPARTRWRSRMTVERVGDSLPHPRQPNAMHGRARQLPSGW